MEYIANKLTEDYSIGWGEWDEFRRKKGSDAHEDAGAWTIDLDHNNQRDKRAKGCRCWEIWWDQWAFLAIASVFSGK